MTSYFMHFKSSWAWRAPRVLAGVLSLMFYTAPFNRACADTSTIYQPDQPQAASMLTRQQLGAKLFFDSRLSANGSISCATCHAPEKAFADGKPVAQGLRGAQGVRNTPTLINAAQNEPMFWDGRRQSLEEQAGDPFVHPSEHGLASLAALVQLLQGDPGYRVGFDHAFNESSHGSQRPPDPAAITPEHVFAALAAFERTLVAGNSAFDRYLFGAQPTALSEPARRGFSLFIGRARCSICHVIGPTSAPLTDGKFHALGVGLEKISARLPDLIRLATTSTLSADRLMLAEPDIAALGRYLVTHEPTDLGAFKTPSLRNVALTAPYMHDGSIATLSEAVDREVYYRGTRENGRLLILTPSERADLVAFLESLTSSGLDELAHAARHMAEATAP